MNSAHSLLARVQAASSHTELVHVPHPLWPLPRRHTFSQALPRPLRISILDASFNPPTLAHLALINTRPPSDRAVKDGGEEGDYDARLLLLSVKNADKTLKSTDATYIQRLDMMRLLAERVQPRSNQPTLPESEINENVAIGITNEPTFVGKSKSLLSDLHNHVVSLRSVSTQTSGDSQTPLFELSFIVGMDTLQRLVAPRYYGSEEAMIASLNRFLSPEEDNSIVVCARRNTAAPSTAISPNLNEEHDILKFAKPFIQTSRIKLIDIGEDESTYSSTTVRNTVKQLGVDDEGRKEWGRFVVPSIEEYIVNKKLYA